MIDNIPLSNIATGGSLPILEWVWLNALKEQMVLTAGNGQVFVRRRMPGKFETALDVCVPIKGIREWAGRLEGPFKFSLIDDEKLRVSAGRNRVVLPTKSSEDYPYIPLDGEELFQCPLEEFQRASKRVRFAAAKSRSVLEHVFISDGQMVAADGFRLAMDTFPYEGDPHSLLVSTEALKAVEGMTEDTLTVKKVGNHIIFSTPTEDILCVPLNETYIDYKRVIPTKFVSEVVIDSKKLATAVGQSLLFTENYLHLVITDDGSILVWAVGAETGDCRSEQDANVDGVALDIFIDGNFVRQGLDKVTGEITLKAEGKEGRLMLSQGSWTYIVMTAREAGKE